MEGKIYKICSGNTDKFYIGSTTKTLSRRLNQHFYDYNNFLKGIQNYMSSFEILKLGEVSIIPIETVLVSNKNELKGIEGRHISNNRDLCVNINDATNEVYKGNEKAYKSKHYVRNREKYKTNSQEYYALNASEIKNRSHEYYEKNRDIIMLKQREKMRCDICNCEVRKAGYAEHKQSTKHKNNVSKLI